MADTVFALFETREDAERAVNALLDAGYDKDQVGVLGPGDEKIEPYGTKAAAGVAGGTAVGAVIGGVLGAAAVGLIPGVGPLLAAGTLIPVIAGTATVGATGGVAGALVAMATNHEEALYYAQQVEAGNWLLTVTTEDRSATAALLDAEGAFGLPPIGPATGEA